MTDAPPPPAAVPWRLVLLLGALTAFAPMSIDMYLSSLPSIGRALHAGPEQTQATLAAFFAGMAIGQFIYGPASDRLGRRPPLLIGIAVFFVASAVCALAPNIETLIAALEHARPALRRQLPWSRATLEGWQINHKARYTRPLGRALARIFDVFFVSLGAPDLGVGILVQRECGLRPSEMLGLEEGDVPFPEDRGGAKGSVAVTALGVRQGTKAKREQSVVLRDVRLVVLLRSFR